MGGALNSNFQFSKGPEGAVLGNIKQREKSFGKTSVNFDVANCQFASEILCTGWSYLHYQNVLCYTEFFTPTPGPGCYDGQLRFGDTSSGTTPTGAYYTQGRVEVCINGTFGAICDVGWDQLDAQVACREFGYNSTSFGR